MSSENDNDNDQSVPDDPPNVVEESPPPLREEESHPSPIIDESTTTAQPDIPNDSPHGHTNNNTINYKNCLTYITSILTSKQKQQELINLIRHNHPSKFFFIVTILVTLIYQHFQTIIYSLYTFIMNAIGTSIGIGFGLGFAFHVKEILDCNSYTHYFHNGYSNDDTNDTDDDNHHNHPEQIKRRRNDLKSPFYSLYKRQFGNNLRLSTTTMNGDVGLSINHHNNNDPMTQSITNSNHDNSNSNHTSYPSYHSLMTNAGYNIPKNLLRGQILRNLDNNQDAKSRYAFCLNGDILSNRQSLYTFPTPYYHDQQQDGQDYQPCISSDTMPQPYNGKGKYTFSRMYPTLHERIQNELGLVVDLVTRDYITSWYGYVDSGVMYEDVKKKYEEDQRKRQHRQRQQQREKKDDHNEEKQQLNSSTATSISNSNNDTMTTMVLSTSSIRTIPFLEILYTSLTTLLGNLSMYIGDNINVSELVLIKLVHILKVNIRTYRAIREVVVEKNREKMNTKSTAHSTSSHSNEINQDGVEIGSRSNAVSGEDGDAKIYQDESSKRPAKTSPSSYYDISEIAMIKEYLVQGKLHQAITFGMDVPGLLFGDMNGDECPPPDYYHDPLDKATADNNNSCKKEHPIVDQVLKRRLFGNNCRMLYECELDYNRVLAHRIARIIFPRADFTSPILKSAVVEMLASCVLTPIMGCATPDMINGFIVSMLEDTNSADADADAGTRKEKVNDADNIMKHSEGYVVESDDDDDEHISDHTDYGGSFGDEETEDGDLDSNHKRQIMRVNSIELSVVDSGSMSYEDPSDEILTLLSMALIEIGAYVDYDDARKARAKGEDLIVDWDDKGCKEVMRNLVLVIESALIHGLLPNQRKNKISSKLADDDAESEYEYTTSSHAEHSSMINLLMEVTSDLESFETSAMEKYINLNSENYVAAFHNDDQVDVQLLPKPNINDLATLRTLIAAWLHSGLCYRTVTALFESGEFILAPFYHQDAFILDKDNAEAFLRQLRILNEIELIVDTNLVIACQPLDLSRIDRAPDGPGTLFPPTLPNSPTDPQKNVPKSPSSKRILRLTSGLKNNRIVPDLGLGRTIKANFQNNKKKLSNLVRAGQGERVSMRMQSVQRHGSFDSSPQSRPRQQAQVLPSHLNFHRNEGFATSLRNERETRMKSFYKLFSEAKKNAEMVCRSRVGVDGHLNQFRDLHSLAKCFSFSTNAIILKGEPKNKEKSEDLQNKLFAQSILILETTSQQRKFNIPEDDSSFLLRAQPTPLDVVSIHRDQRDPNLSYKKYAGYYDEPVLHPLTKAFNGARLRRKCFIRYYPNDRTASITFIDNERRLDCRAKDKLRSCILLDHANIENRPRELRKYQCCKAVRKGTERTAALANSILASTLMDSSDFCNISRSGKAVDFLYKLSLFEEPAIDLSGKRVIVQDASALGCHQADASSLELSDASLSTSLILNDERDDKQFYIKSDSKNYPLVFMKVVVNSNNTSLPSEKKRSSLYKSFKISLVRAALLVASSRKEAQLKCLVSCLRAGSPKKPTKAEMDHLLQMPLFLLQHATSKKMEKQSILLRDLKLGINHVDRDQLRRNGIWHSRYPTALKQLKVKVEEATLSSTNEILYKIRCFAVSEYVGVNDIACESCDVRKDGKQLEYGDVLQEEWVVWRPFRDFATLHRVLKSVVNPAESSAGAGAKLVGAATGLATAATGLATAALTIGNSAATGPSRASASKRKPLVPSLSQASKAGALGETKKSVAKRRQVLHDYLGHLLAHGNLLNRCPELLRFIGAYDPLPHEVKLDQEMIPDFTDNLGRSEMRKLLLQSESMQILVATPPLFIFENEEVNDQRNLAARLTSPKDTSGNSPNMLRRALENKRSNESDPVKRALLESLDRRIDKIKLAHVRANFFDLFRFTFDLDNASFFRNRMVAALKTMSFALTSSHGFKKTLLDFHLNYLSGKSIAYYIHYLREKIWPDRVIYTKSPELTIEEKNTLMMQSSALLHKVFPDQLSTILGQENTDKGIDILHEMLQNRVVLKSIFYMMMDAVWLEIFPELGDVVTCSKTLDNIQE